MGMSRYTWVLSDKAFGAWENPQAWCVCQTKVWEQGRQWQMVYQKQRNATTLNVRHGGSYFPLSGDVFDYCKTCKPYSRGLVCEKQSGWDRRNMVLKEHNLKKKKIIRSYKVFWKNYVLLYPTELSWKDLELDVLSWMMAMCSQTSSHKRRGLLVLSAHY